MFVPEQNSSPPARHVKSSPGLMNSAMPGAGLKDALRAVHDAVAELQVFETNTVRELARGEVRSHRVRRSVVHVGERLIHARVEPRMLSFWS